MPLHSVFILLQILCFPYSALANQCRRHISTIFWLNCIQAYIYIFLLQNDLQIGLFVQGKSRSLHTNLCCCHTHLVRVVENSGSKGPCFLS